MGEGWGTLGKVVEAGESWGDWEKLGESEGGMGEVRRD